MRKTILLLLSTFVCAAAFCNHTNNYTKEEKAALALIARIIPKHYSQVNVEKSEEKSNNDFFEISSKNGKVFLKGNNAISIAMAFHWYLKYNCNAHLSWNGNQMSLPAKLPLPSIKKRVDVNAAKRVYFNYCTLNYSASWWDWERWQTEIDYMAMNGINMPLAATGLEAVWYHTLLKLGLTDGEARDFLVGPAYFAWQWMTNIQSHCGPLPKSWIDSHIQLQKKILARELELGMQPIQQGFSGCVPRIFQTKFSDAKIKIQNDWCAFEGTAQLDPLDPLFSKIGKLFLETQKELFGSYGAYAADPFHEGEPPEKSKEYLNKVGKGIFELMNSFDSKALWVMQSWSIREGIATMVPKDRLLILSLDGGVSGKNFWGYPFVAGNLHNFGGRINLHGDLNLLASNQFAKTKIVAPNVVGSGLFMEAIEQNPVYYDLAFEMPLHNDSVDIHAWLKKYSLRRYGISNQNIVKAWELLLENPYRKGTNGTENSSIICARPALNVKKSGPNSGFNIPYKPEALHAALNYLLSASKQIKNTDAYYFDLVDVLRQIISNLGQEIHKKAIKEFENKNAKSFKEHSNTFLQLLLDADKLLSLRKEYSFYKWLNDAKKWGTNEVEKNLYDKNASMLVTHWGATGDAVIFDYSWREWGGLLKYYYYPRWEKFYNMLSDSLLSGKTYSEANLPFVHGRETLRANAFYNSLADWELNWIETPKTFSENPRKENTLQIVKELFEKYEKLAKKY